MSKTVSHRTERQELEMTHKKQLDLPNGCLVKARFHMVICQPVLGATFGGGPRLERGSGQRKRKSEANRTIWGGANLFQKNPVRMSGTGDFNQHKRG